MTVGDPVKLLVAFSLPLLIGNVFQQLYNLADAVVVGNTLGVGPFAAVGSTGSVMFLIFGGFFGLTGGFGVVTAQRFGASDEAGVRHSIATSTYISIALGAIITVLGAWGTRPILTLMDTPPDIFADAELYLRVIFYGTLTGVFYNLVATILRSLGDSRTPLVALIIASVINIVLDLFFICVLKTGVDGAAWATNLSQLLAAAWCLRYVYPRLPLLHLRRADWRFDWRAVQKHLLIGVPMALQFSITALGVVVLQKVLNSLGTASVAAYAAAGKLDQFTIMPLFSVGMAMVTYAAQNYGARHYDRIQLGVRKCQQVVLAGCVLGSIVIVLFGRPLIIFFIGGAEEDVLNLAEIFLLTHAITYPLLGLIFVYRNVLQGVGRAILPMLAGLMEMAARVFAALLLVPLLGFWGACLSNPLAWLSADVLLIAAYRAWTRSREMRAFRKLELKVES
jgi:putative MATE family efflux protein